MITIVAHTARCHLCVLTYVSLFLQATRQAQGGVDKEEQTHVLQG